MVELKDIKMYVPAFRKLKEFDDWWFAFKAYAQHKGFREVLNEEKYKELPEKENQESQTDMQKEAVKMNKMAMSSFCMAFSRCEAPECTAYVLESIDEDWPSGKAWEVVTELLEEFVPSDLMGQVDQRRALDKISIGKHENPKNLFAQITRIQNKYKDRCVALTNEDKLCAVIVKAPEQYNNLILETRSQAIKETNKEPQLKVLRKKMYDLWLQDQAAFARRKKGKGVELTFYTGESDEDRGKENRTQKGRNRSDNKGKKCYLCGEVGHIKRDCPKLNKSGNAKVCTHCGKKGHTEAECWKKHPEKKPNWLKEKDKTGEVVGIAVDGELAFTVHDMEKNQIEVDSGRLNEEQGSSKGPEPSLNLEELSIVETEQETSDHSSGFLVFDVDKMPNSDNNKAGQQANEKNNNNETKNNKSTDTTADMAAKVGIGSNKDAVEPASKRRRNRKRNTKRSKAGCHCQLQTHRKIDCNTKANCKNAAIKSMNASSRNTRVYGTMKKTNGKGNKFNEERTWKRVESVRGPNPMRIPTNRTGTKGVQRKKSRQRQRKFQQNELKFRKFEKDCKDKWDHVSHSMRNQHKRATANGWYRSPGFTQNRLRYVCTKDMRSNNQKRDTKCSRAKDDARARTTITTEIGHIKITVETMPAVKTKSRQHWREMRWRGHSKFGRESSINNREHDVTENELAELAFLNAEKEDQTNEKQLKDLGGTNMLYSPVIWVADTGASCHITNSVEGAVPSRQAGARLLSMKDSIDASGNTMKTTKIVDIKGSVLNSTGKRTNFTLTNCRFGASKFNLCSLTKMTESGWTMVGDTAGIRLTKGEAQIRFDIPIKTAEGRLWAARIDRRAPNNEANEFTLATPTTMNLEKAHAFCGHTNLRDTRKTAQHLGWTITRTPFTRCEACAVAKAKQADLGQGEEREPNYIGELWYVDGLQLKKPKTTKNSKPVHFPANNCFTLAVEHKTGALIHSWATTKKGFIGHFCREFHHLANTHNKTVKRIRCDDGGENIKFQQTITGEPWKMDIQFEYTAKTPQRNSRVETKLYNICNKTRAALEAANVPDQYRYVLFVLFAKWCCQTDMLQVIDVAGDTMTKYEHLAGGNPGWIEHMQIAGMAGVVKTHSMGTPKVAARGKICMFAHYAKDHAKDCYVMFDPKTLKIIHSRDVLWLNRMYFDSTNTAGAPIQVHGPTPTIDLIAPVEQGSDTEETSSTEASETSDPISEEETASEEESDSDNNSDSDSNEDREDDLIGDNWKHPEEEIVFQPNTLDTPTRTRSGRTIRERRAHDGTVLKAPKRRSRKERVELVAAAIQEDYIEAIGSLGVEEMQRTTPEFIDESLDAEEHLLLHMTKGETLYTSIESAFGFIDDKGDHRLVAAILETGDHELHLVGATGHNYGNTSELNVMTYKQAMATADKKEWEKAVKMEHDKMVKYNVFKVVHPSEIPKGAKRFDSTWAMKKKADGTYRARNAIRGFQQVDGAHYDSHDKSSPVATEVGIRIVFVLALQAGYYQHLVDVEGAFLNGEFQHPDKHKMYMSVPEAFKQWYPPWAVFLLLRTQYGTIQAALQYYRECCKALSFLKFKRNPAEPCIFYKWVEGQLILFVLWVDDCCVTGPKHLVQKTVEEFKSLWDCKDLGELNEYVGCKVERTDSYIRLTQPVKVQRFIDEFGCTGDNGPSHRAPSTPAEPGSVLEYNEKRDKPLNPAQQTEYRSGVGILLHMMRWSRPDVLNAVRELSTHMQKAGKNCLKALKRVMNFIISTKERGFTFRVNDPGQWDGRRETKEFRIVGKCDSEYAKHTSRRSVNAGITYLEGAIVKQFSKMMPIVALSTTEAELYSAVMTAQDMMFVYHVLRGIGLRVKLPMTLYCDNKGAVDLANNWSVGGRTRHVDVKQNFLRELKDHGFLKIEWRSGEDMTPDMHTKNVSKQLFDRYSAELVS